MNRFNYLLVICCVLYPFAIQGQQAEDSRLVQKLDSLSQAFVQSGEYTRAILFQDSAGVYLAKRQQWETLVAGKVEIAKALTANGEPDLSIDVLNKGLAVGLQQLASDHELIKEVYYQLARASFLGNAFAECITYTQKSLALRTQQIEERDYIISAHYNYMGMAHLQLGDYQTAKDALEKALVFRTIAVGAEDPRIASLHNNLGQLYVTMNQLGKAESFFRKALEIRTAVYGAANPRVVTTYLNLANVLDEKGNYQEAIRLYSKALNILEKGNKESVNLARIYNNLGISYKNEGAYEESLYYLKQSGLIFSKLSTQFRAELADTYTNQANVYSLIEKYNQAIELHHKALDLHLEIFGSHAPVIEKHYTNLGLAYLGDDQLEKSLEYHLRALQLVENQPDREAYQANRYNNLAEVYWRMGAYEKAINYNLQALDIQTRVFGVRHPSVAFTNNSLAKNYLSQKAYAKGLSAAQTALIANHQTFNQTDWKLNPSKEGYYRYDYFVESLLLKAQLLSEREEGALEDLVLANAVYDQTDKVLTELRDQLVTHADKITQAKNIHRLSTAAISNNLALYNKTRQKKYLEHAFHFSEKSKATVLLSDLAAREAMRSSGIPDSILLREERLQNDIRYFKEQLALQHDSTKNQGFQGELFTTQQAYRQHKALLEQQFPEYFQLKHQRQALSLEKLQADMSLETAVISYFSTDDSIYIFQVNKESIQVKAIPMGEDFVADWYELQLILSEPEETEEERELFQQLAFSLYEKLFPFSLKARIKKLVLIPDGQLVKIPFEVLLTNSPETDGSSSYSSIPYLIQRFEIAYSPSAALFWQGLQQQSSLHKNNFGDLLAFAPVFKDLPQRTITNSTKVSTVGVDPFSDRGFFVNDTTYLRELPGSEREVDTLAQLFRSNGRTAKVYMHQNATEARFRGSEAESVSFLHLATHGILDKQQTDLSRIYLYPDSTNQQDGFLSAWEVYGLNLQAKLVVLSACQTGTGKETKGEGLLGLSRAFLYAGANNLVVSLWNVNDYSTSELMAHFYRNYLTTTEPSFSKCLQKAKQKMINSEEYHHPYYWSSFVLIGR